MESLLEVVKSETPEQFPFVLEDFGTTGRTQKPWKDLEGCFGTADAPIDVDQQGAMFAFAGSPITSLGNTFVEEKVRNA